MKILITDISKGRVELANASSVIALIQIYYFILLVNFLICILILYPYN